MTQTTNQALKTYKPDLDEVTKRWEAYWNGDIIDRPIILASCTKTGFERKPSSTYHERAFGNMDEIFERELYNASGTYYGGDLVPTFWGSLGADEIAVYCGGSLEWNQESNMDTNWSHPFIKDWEEALPLKLDRSNVFWKRLLELYSKGAEAFQGKILLFPIDFHTNMDLLLAARGGENLCMDLADCPELIDKAMENAREIFKEIWLEVKKVGRMDEFGYWFDAYSVDKSVCVLACDFSCMIGTGMFRRWVLPTLEFEASLVDRVLYHWDGPAALRHHADLIGIEKIHTFSYVPDPFERHTQYVDLYKKVQASGKGVVVSGTVDEVKNMHKELNPAKTIYKLEAHNKKEIDSLITWLKRNT